MTDPLDVIWSLKTTGILREAQCRVCRVRGNDLPGVALAAGAAADVDEGLLLELGALLKAQLVELGLPPVQIALIAHHAGAILHILRVAHQLQHRLCNNVQQMLASLPLSHNFCRMKVQKVTWKSHCPTISVTWESRK